MKRATQDTIILLAEDWEPDVALVRRAFKCAELSNPLYVVRDGEETVSYLAGLGKFADRAEYPFPDLLLLDLKLPKMDGFDVLRWIRQQPGGRKLLVMVLTSSEDVYHVNRAYALGANSFLVKPIDLENYTALARTMARFWSDFYQEPKMSTDDLPRENELYLVNSAADHQTTPH
jgi:CheY-like chemotaxis protein